MNVLLVVVFLLPNQDIGRVSMLRTTSMEACQQELQVIRPYLAGLSFEASCTDARQRRT